MNFTPDMSVGHYWFRQDHLNLNGSYSKGVLEIIFVSPETSYRRKPTRLVIGKHWQETLDKMIVAQSPKWKISELIQEPNFD